MVILRMKLEMAARVRDFLLANPFEYAAANRVAMRYMAVLDAALDLLARHQEERRLAHGSGGRGPARLETLVEVQGATQKLMRELKRLDRIAIFAYRGMPEMRHRWEQVRNIAWPPAVPPEFRYLPPTRTHPTDRPSLALQR